MQPRLRGLTIHVKEMTALDNDHCNNAYMCHAQNIMLTTTCIYCHAVNPDEAIALALQQKELARYRRTRPRQGDVAGVGFQARGGARVLFLDGGGVKGLAQIESLIQIEQKTGRRITELFDWIVGTSTGAIIALGLVYGMYRYLHCETGSGVRHVYGQIHWGTGSGLWNTQVPPLAHWVRSVVCSKDLV